MRIGFDAKRYFHNTTGLGNYSRTLIKGLTLYYPHHEYFLFNTKKSSMFAMPDQAGIVEVLPQNFLDKKFPSVWRSSRIKKDIEKLKLDLYHGLSHEIPNGINKIDTRPIVTVHDLIFERYPSQYGTYEVRMHRHKIQYACRYAHAVIAASLQTKIDLIERYGVPENKIEVCYQSCNPAFTIMAPLHLQQEIKKQYKLPDAFFLYVGSIIERKNLLGICKAINEVKDVLHLPLVVVGKGGAYQQKVVAYLSENNLEGKVIFLSVKKGVSPELDLNKANNLAALYQMAKALIYPSYFEGFGIPVLEALWSCIPVITSNVSSMPEIGEDAVYYVDPSNQSQLASAMLSLQNDIELCKNLAEKGKLQAQKFSLQLCTDMVMKVYQKVMNHATF